MKIINLNEKYFPTYSCCFEDWSEEMTHAGEHKRNWYETLKEKGLCIKLALDENDVAVGLIQYLPAKYSFIEAENIYMIHCIWVQGYKEKGAGDKQKLGYGKALIDAAVADVKALGADGIAAWGLTEPFWMPASWYKKQGFKSVEVVGMQELVWKKFKTDAVPPRWLEQKKAPQKVAGKVKITAFISGWCTAYNVGFENFRKAADEFDERVEFNIIKTLEDDNLQKWGLLDEIFIDDEQINLGPPPSYEDTVQMIQDKLDKL